MVASSQKLPTLEQVQAELARRGIVNTDDFEALPEFIGDHAGQFKAWKSSARILAIIAGWQSGKTVIGPPLLRREIQRRGPGDYAALAPTFPLLANKLLPELRRWLDPYFELKKADNVFVIRPGADLKIWGKAAQEPTRILLRHTDNSDAVEAFTAKALLADEPGQMADEIWEAMQARCAVNQGRLILTSRPYRSNFLVREIWDKRFTDPDVQVVNFRSIDNPAFPASEYERQKRLLPPWKFRMKYDGIPTKPAGVIYDIVNSERHGVPRFTIPVNWKRYAWIDFGNNNTAALKVAEELREGLKPRYFIYSAYHPGDRRSASGEDGHVARLKKGEAMTPFGVGGSHQEDGWRDSWATAGMPVKEPPINRIDEQIAQAYELFADDRLFIFSDLSEVWDEISDYAWPVDENGEVVRDDKPENDATFHLMAALRYGAAFVNPPKAKRTVELKFY